jgi:imidazolonepropionase-like amidohydrolase
VAAGVTLVRSPGLAADPPAWFGTDEELPRAQHAGPWLVQAGQFFDGWGRRPEHADLPAVAAEQAARTGWAKIVGDWDLGDPVVPADVLRATVEAVHAAGGRIAVHSQQADGGANAVAAGVDSLEHGIWLDEALLPEMAERGVALTPTLSVFLGLVEDVRTKPDGPRKDWFVGGTERHGALAAAAAEAGVTLLAGTDSRPHGRVADEVRVLAAAGVPAHTALGAASWTARSFLGLPGLVPDAPADVTVYADDPRTDLASLDHPTAVILRGIRRA